MFFLMVVSQMKTGYFQRHNISLQKNSLLQLFIRLFWCTVEEVVLFEQHACMTSSPTDQIVCSEHDWV